MRRRFKIQNDFRRISMKKLRILFTAVIITCFASLFCGCKTDEWGLMDIEVDLILFEEPAGKYELTIKYNGIEETRHYDIEETDCNSIKCVRMREYEYYKEVLTEEEFNSNYTFLKKVHFYLETRKNVEFNISYIQDINDVKTKYTSTVVIPYVKEDGRYYSGRENILFTGDNGKNIPGYLIYQLDRSI